ncbi:MAG: hypothetical protein ACREPP_08855, partial [Rhodanobacteraceae bacterium]
KNRGLPATGTIAILCRFSQCESACRAEANALMYVVVYGRQDVEAIRITGVSRNAGLVEKHSSF